jgi:D-alanine-D-alanine ligase
MKVLVLCHSLLVPRACELKWPDRIIENRPWRTEGFVAKALLELGHEVHFCGIDDQLNLLRTALSAHRPDVVFNLLEEFSGEGLLEPLPLFLIEDLGFKFTGSSGQALMLARNKVATNQLLSSVGVRVPGQKKYPRIVKFVTEESSFGITTASIVKSPSGLQRQIRKLRSLSSADIYSEEYIEGRELFCGVMVGAQNTIVSSLWETKFGRMRGPKILTEKAKWDFKYRDQIGIRMMPAEGLGSRVVGEASRFVQTAVEELGIVGAARFDFRLSEDGELYLIEVNPNPDLAKFDEFALCMGQTGMGYLEVIDSIVRAGRP